MLDYKNLTDNRRAALAKWGAKLGALIDEEMCKELGQAEVVWLLLHYAKNIISEWMHDTWDGQGLDLLYEELRKQNEVELNSPDLHNDEKNST